MLKNKKHYVKVLLKSFHLSGHSNGFFSQTQKLDQPRCTLTLSGSLCGSEKKGLFRRGMLTIYINHPGVNLLHKYKTKKFDVVGGRSATKYIQIKRVEKLHHL